MAKENSGASARKRRQQRVAAYIVGALIIYVFVTTLFEAHFAGMFVPDVEVDAVTGRKRVRRRPERQRKKTDPQLQTDAEDGILEGVFTLAELAIPPDGLMGSSGRYKAQASFCKIDWVEQQKDPSVVPMFRDLRAKSKMCEATMVTVDLNQVAFKSRAFDARFNSTQHAVQSVPPTGVVFQESRCGSTLVANLLASSAPTTTRVFSESPPPLKAISACDLHPCNPDLHVELIQDVFYMMGRTAQKSKDQRVFYKIQSIGSMNIDKFTAAFPETPWMYLYRDNVEVLKSHWKGVESSWMDRTPVCARNYNNPRQPPTTLQILAKKNKTPKKVSKMEYCAAHLAGLSLSAIQEHERTGRGRFVNYKQLPNVMYDTVMPRDFGVTVTEEMRARMEKSAGVYSKGRGDKAKQEWKDDSEKKQSTASQPLISAAEEYASETYDSLEALSDENL